MENSENIVFGERKYQMPPPPIPEGLSGKGVMRWQMSGLREYFRGWSRMTDLTQTQLKVLNLIEEGSSARLPSERAPMYNKFMKYMLKNEVIRPAEISVLQKDGIRMKFLDKDIKAQLREAGVEVSKGGYDSNYFRDLRSKLYDPANYEDPDVASFEEMAISRQLELEYQNGGREAADGYLERFMTGEESLDNVTRQWVKDYVQLHKETDTPIELGDFFDAPSKPGTGPDSGDVPLIPREDFGNELTVWEDENDQKLPYLDEEGVIDLGDVEMAEIVRPPPLMQEPLDPELAAFQAAAYEAHIQSIKNIVYEPGKDTITNPDEYFRDFQGVPENMTIDEFITARRFKREAYDEMYEIWRKEIVLREAGIGKAQPIPELRAPDVQIRSGIQDAFRGLNQEQLAGVAQEIGAELRPGIKGIGLVANEGLLKQWLKKTGFGLIPAMPIGFFTNWLNSQAQGAGDMINLSLATGDFLTGLLSGPETLTDPFALLMMGVAELVSTVNTARRKQLENDIPDKAYGTRFGYVRVGDKWMPAMLESVEPDTGWFAQDNKMRMRYGSALKWVGDGKGGWRPEFEDAHDREFVVQDDVLHKSGIGTSIQYNKHWNSVRDWYFLNPDDAMEFMDGTKEFVPLDDWEPVSPYTAQLDNWRRAFHTVSTYNGAPAASELGISAYDPETFDGMNRQLSRILTENRSTIGVFNNGIDDATIGYLPALAGGWENYNKQLATSGLLGSAALPFKDFLLDTVLKQSMDDLYTAQFHAATEQGFESKFKLPWEEDKRTDVSGWLDAQPTDVYTFAPVPPTAWSILYRDTDKDLPLATNAAELQAQLDTIGAYDDRTQLQQDYLGQKAIVRFWMDEIASVGGTNDMQEWLFNDNQNLSRYLGPGMQIYDANGSREQNRILPRPWMNEGDNLIPELFGDEQVSDYWRDKNDTRTKKMLVRQKNWIDARGGLDPDQLLKDTKVLPKKTGETETVVADTTETTDYKTDDGLASFIEKMEQVKLPDWCYDGIGKKKKLLISDRTDAILMARRLFADTKAFTDMGEMRHLGSKHNFEVFSALQQSMPELTPAVVGDPVEFLTEYAAGRILYLTSEYDSKGNLVIPESFVPDTIPDDQRDAYEAFIASIYKDPQSINQFLALEDKLNEHTLDTALDYQELDEFDPMLKLAKNRLGHVELWDDPTLQHTIDGLLYKRVVKFADGTIKEQGHYAPGAIVHHERETTPLPTAVHHARETTPLPVTTKSV